MLAQGRKFAFLSVFMGETDSTSHNALMYLLLLLLFISIFIAGPNYPLWCIWITSLKISAKGSQPVHHYWGERQLARQCPSPAPKFNCIATTLFPGSDAKAFPGPGRFRKPLMGHTSLNTAGDDFSVLLSLSTPHSLHSIFPVLLHEHSK